MVVKQAHGYNTHWIKVSPVSGKSIHARGKIFIQASDLFRF